MKKRYLRPCIQNALTVIDVGLFSILAIIDDYELSFLPYYTSGVVIVGLITYVLYKYGKWEIE